MTEDKLPGFFSYHDREGFHTIVLDAVIGTSRPVSDPENDSKGLGELKVFMANGMGFKIDEKEYIAQFFTAYREHLSAKCVPSILAAAVSAPITASVHRVGSMSTAELSGGRPDEIAEILAAAGLTPKDVEPTYEYCIQRVLNDIIAHEVWPLWKTVYAEGTTLFVAGQRRPVEGPRGANALRAYGWDNAKVDQLEHDLANRKPLVLSESDFYPTPESCTKLSQILDRWNTAIGAGEIRNMTRDACIAIERTSMTHQRIEALQVELRSANIALTRSRAYAKEARDAVDKLKAQLDKSEATLAAVFAAVTGDAGKDDDLN